MSFEQLFTIANLIAMLGWLILIFLPRRWPVLNLIPFLILPVILSFGYSLVIGLNFFETEGGFGSLKEVQQLFTAPALALGGWIHYLAFDMLIGGFIARKADEIGLSRLIQAPILFATFMFGPFGYLLFTLVSGFMVRGNVHKMVNDA